MYSILQIMCNNPYFQDNAFDKSQRNLFREDWLIQKGVINAFKKWVSHENYAAGPEIESNSNTLSKKIDLKSIQSDELDDIFLSAFFEGIPHIRSWNDLLSKKIENDVIHIIRCC